MEKVRQYLLTKWFNIKKNRHTNLFDVFFILVSFIFFPLFDLVNGLFKNFVNDSRNIVLAYAPMLILLIFVIICRIPSNYLKRFAVQQREQIFGHGQRLFLSNMVGVILFYLSTLVHLASVFIGLVAIVNLLPNSQTTKIYTLYILLGVFFVLLLVLLVFAFIVDIRLYLKLDKPLNPEEKLFAKKWFSNPNTEFFADCLLFSYILCYQFVYYSFVAQFDFKEQLAKVTTSYGNLVIVIFWVIYLWLLFLLFYVAPRTIYSETYKENGTNRWMLFLVFVSTLFAHLMPNYISWLF